MSLIFALIGDLGAFIIIWRGAKLVFQKHQKMFETEADFKIRKLTGWGICFLGLLVVIANHTFFKF